MVWDYSTREAILKAYGLQTPTRNAFMFEDRFVWGLVFSAEKSLMFAVHDLQCGTVSAQPVYLVALMDAASFGGLQEPVDDWRVPPSEISVQVSFAADELLVTVDLVHLNLETVRLVRLGFA